MTAWPVERSAGPAADLHGRDLPEVPVAAVWVHDVTRPAIVLGSTQPAEDVDEGVAAELGIDVVRRRSGGGAVLLQPGASLWVDVVVPSTHPAWDADVSRAARWMGDTWARALARVGVVAPAAHHGSMTFGPLGRQVCFAGMGPGEVTVPMPITSVTGSSAVSESSGGRAKLVGISQRRTRAAARFQAIVHRRWDLVLQERLLGPGLARAAVARGEQRGASADVGTRVGAAAPPALADVAVAVLAVPDDEVIDALHTELAGRDRRP